MHGVNLTDEQVSELHETLTGTCQSLDDVCQQLFDCTEEELSRNSLERIDDLMFKCVECDWWNDNGELADIPGKDESYCLECRPDDDD